MVGKKENRTAVCLKQCLNANEGNSIIPTFGCLPSPLPVLVRRLAGVDRRIVVLMLCSNVHFNSTAGCFDDNECF